MAVDFKRQPLPEECGPERGISTFSTPPSIARTAQARKLPTAGSWQMDERYITPTVHTISPVVGLLIRHSA